MAQVAPRPASWKARAAPSALGSLAAPTRTCLACDSRRCLRTRSNATLNWPSPSSVAIRHVSSESGTVSFSPASTPLFRPCTRDPARPERSGPSQFQQQDLIDAPTPLAARPPSQVAAGQEARLVVVRAEIRGARMRGVYPAQ